MAAESAELRRLIGKHSASRQFGRPDPELTARMRAVSREEKIKRLVQQAPPLPADIRARLARLLAPADVADVEESTGGVA